MSTLDVKWIYKFFHFIHSIWHSFTVLSVSQFLGQGFIYRKLWIPGTPASFWYWNIGMHVCFWDSRVCASLCQLYTWYKDKFSRDTTSFWFASLESMWYQLPSQHRLHCGEWVLRALLLLRHERCVMYLWSLFLNISEENFASFAIVLPSGRWRAGDNSWLEFF